ncbi:MAG TPA: hypothetical protein VMF06_00575 [Candidatus Limnocylindria bacterium]|nr:hypothetical protein [Candidatus Limnocylindria bacterium]
MVAFILAAICVTGLLQSGVPYRTQVLDGWSIDNPNFLGLGTRVRDVELKSSPLPMGGIVHEIEVNELTPLPLNDLRSMVLRLDVRKDLVARDADLVETLVHSATFEARDGSNTVFRLAAKSESYLSSEGRLEFLRQSAAGNPTNRSDKWVLRVVTETNIRLFLRANVSEPGRLTEPLPGGGRLVIPLAPTEKGRSFAYPLGDLTLKVTAPAASRAALLAYLWQMDHLRSVYGWVLLAAALIGLGVMFFPWHASLKANLLPDALRAGAGVAAMFAALGLVQLLLTPPLFGTDEPAHVFSYHLWMSDTDAANRTWVLGERNHAIRMLWHPSQKFATADLNDPFGRFVDSPFTMYTRPGARSASGMAMWKLSRWFVAGKSAAAMIFRLRLVSLTVVVLCVALGVSIIAFTGSPGAPTGWIGLGLLLIPSLPYYAMNVSNYPLVLGGGIVVAASIAGLINQSITPGWLGFFLGSGTSLLFFSSASCWPMGAVVFCAILGLALRRLFIVPDGGPMVNLNFWFALALGLSFFSLLATPQFRAQQGEYAALALNHIGIHVVPSYLGMVWLCCALFAGFEWVCSLVASETSATLGAVLAKFSVVLGWVAIGLIVVNMFVRPTELEALPEAVPHWEFHVGRARAVPLATDTFERQPLPSPLHYAATAMKAVATSVSLGHHDYLTEKLFWLTVGSIETGAPNWILSMLFALIAGGLAWLFFRISATRNGPRLVQVIFILVGLAICLAATAIGSIVSPAYPTLHGRYLIGFHITWFLVALVGFKSPMLYVQWRSPRLFAIVWLGLVLLIHGTCFVIELDRYF